MAMPNATRLFGARATAALLIATSACASSGSTGWRNTMTSSTRPTGEQSGVMTRGPIAEWTADVVYVNGRARMDITSGEDRLYSKGDYVLSDSIETFVVRPATKTFYAIPDLSNADSIRKRLPTSFTLKDVVAKADSTLPNEVVSGITTRHYRVSVSATMEVDVSRMLSADVPTPDTRMQMTITSDYWLVDERTFPKGWRVPGRPQPRMRPELSGLPDSVIARFAAIPKGTTPIKMTIATRATSAAMGISSGMEVTVLTSKPTRHEVDLALFVIPDGYTEIASPIMAMLGSGELSRDGGARWRARKQ
jgi:hypothetical protein